MRRRVIHSVLAFLTGALAAQDPESRPASQPTSRPAPDAAVGKLIAAWEEREYNAGRAGLRRLACEVRVVSRGGMTGTFEAVAKYRFGDDPKRPDGELVWDDEEVEHAMTRRGFTAAFFARWLRSDGFRAQLAGAELALYPARKGSILEAKREGADDTHLLFDEKGVLVGRLTGTMRSKLHHRPHGDRLLWSGEESSMPGVRAELGVEYEAVGGYQLPKSITEKVEVRGQLLSDLTLTLTKFDLDQQPRSRPTTRKESDPGR